MGLRQRILDVTGHDLGPAKRTVLSGLARGKDDFDKTFERMLERGEIVMYGDKKGARYGVPGWKRPRR